MRGLLIISTMLAAFAAEWGINAALAGTGLFLPLSGIAFCLWIRRMAFGPRMWFALPVGFVMDSASPGAFGAAIMTCVLVALVCEAFLIFFSDTESRLAQSVSVALLVLLFVGMMPAWNFLLLRFA